MTTLDTTGVVVRRDREGNRVRLTPVGPFDLAHATTAAQKIANAEMGLNGCRAVELDLSGLGRIDGTGVTHELPSIFMVANTCIVLDKAAPRHARTSAGRCSTNAPVANCPRTRSGTGRLRRTAISTRH